jgi:phenylalanyl-tRNA synthetase beta chain
VAEVHPAVAERLDIPDRVAVAELDLETLLARSSPDLVAREPSRFPPVRRDLAFIVDESVAAEGFRLALVEAGGELVESCLLFDVFTGGQLPEGKKSLAFSLDLRAVDRTLTEQEAESVVAGMVERVGTDFGAELRTG